MGRRKSIPVGAASQSTVDGASAIGSALQSLTGTPRMLAAMANDNAVSFLKPFAAKNSDEPRRALMLLLFLWWGPCITG